MQVVLDRLVEEPDVALVACSAPVVIGAQRCTVSGFSPAFRKIDEEFERTRYRMQRERLHRLFDAGRARKGIGFDEARPILWMYTSREIYRMLVIEGGWTPDRSQEWLWQTLITALVEA